MSTAKKYAFIIDPFSSGALYAPEIIKQGITPVAILSCYPVFSIYASSFKSDDFTHIYVNRDDLSDLIKDLTILLEDSKPAILLAGAECGVELADKLTHYFRPDLANVKHLSSCRRNKFDMSQQLLKNYLPAPHTIKSNSIDEILNWSKNNNLLATGVVIKPLNSVGTDSVTACFSEEEIKNAMERYLGKRNLFNYCNDYMLAQEFLIGTEYVVDTVSFATRHRVTNVCRYKKIQANGASFVYDSLDFLPPNDELVSELGDYTFRVLDALGIQYGPAHSEIIYTPKGPRLVETGARAHGGIGISACRMATGNSHLDAILSLTLGNDSIRANQINYEIKKYTKIVFLISYEENLMRAEQPNMESLKNLPSFQLLKLNIKPGDMMKKTTDFFSMPGLLILSHQSESQVEQDYQIVRQLEREGLFGE